VDVEGMLRAATTPGSHASRKLQQLQSAVLADWSPGEDLYIDDQGVVADWDVQLRIPSRKLAGSGTDSIYAFSTEALHLGFMAKQGFMKAGPEHLAFPYGDMRGVEFSRMSGAGFDSYIVEIQGRDGRTKVSMLLTHHHEFTDRASVNLERIRGVLAAHFTG
jgi:hypothetical protein